MSGLGKSREQLLAELIAARQRAEALAKETRSPQPTQPAKVPSSRGSPLESGREAPADRPPLKFVLGIEDTPYFGWQLPIFCESLLGQLPKGWEVLAVVCNDQKPISETLLRVFETYGVRYFSAPNHPRNQDIDFASGGEAYLPLNKIQALDTVANRIDDDDLVCLLDADNFLYRDLDVSIFPRRDALCENWMIAEERFFRHRPGRGEVDLSKLLEAVGCSGEFVRGGVAIFLSGRTVRNEKFVRDCFRFAQVVFLLGRIAGLEKVWWSEMPCYALALAANGVEAELHGAESFVITQPEQIAPGSFYHYYADIVDRGLEGAFHGSKWGKQGFFHTDFLQSDLDSACAAAASEHERYFFELAKRARARLGR